MGERDDGRAGRDLPWREEIEELHRFFQEWFTGELPNTDEAFARVREALSPELVFISPSGERRTTAELLEGIRRGHGKRPGLAIRIEQPELHRTPGGHVVATYREWQEEGERTTVRLSTVVLGPDPSAPNGLTWLHVHETWMAGR